MRLSVIRLLFLGITLIIFSCEEEEKEIIEIHEKINISNDTLKVSEYTIAHDFLSIKVEQFGSVFRTNGLTLFINLDTLKAKLKEAELINNINKNNSEIIFLVWVYYPSPSGPIISEFLFQGTYGESYNFDDKACVSDEPKSVTFFRKGINDMEEESLEREYKITSEDNYWVSTIGSCYSSRIADSKTFLEIKRGESTLRVITGFYSGENLSAFYSNSKDYPL